MIGFNSYKDEYYDLLLDFFRKNDCFFPDPFSKHVDLEAYLTKLANNAYICLAFDDLKIVGFAAAYVNDKINCEAHLQIVLTSKDYQSKGIGSKLLGYIYEKAIQEGMKSIVLVVDEMNLAAQKLYSKLGYCFYQNAADTRKGKLHMRLALNPNTYKIQKRLLEMAKTIIDIFERNGIPYFAAFGTLLGAVRHKGFIPWDDDFDLFLFDDTYDKALDCLRKELTDDMFLEYFDSEPLYFHQWAHVKDVNSIVECSQFPQDGIYEHKGISIDLYRIKLMKEGEVEPFRLAENIKYYERRNKVGWLDDASLALKKSELLARIKNYKNDAQKLVYGMVLNERFVYYEDVMPLKKYSFEDIEIMGPSNADSVLTMFYGEYMKLPDEEHRVPHYSSVRFLNHTKEKDGNN